MGKGGETNELREIASPPAHQPPPRLPPQPNTKVCSSRLVRLQAAGLWFQVTS
uniref:Uncharacterized protein n=1 Tax=Rhizophora mucronata TaxID=61149 RepID=A0A2P2J3Q6_RHIMU